MNASIVGKHSADHKSIAKEHAPSRFEYATDVTQHLEPSREMTQNIVGEHGIKSVVVERKFCRDVTLLETRL